MYKGFSTLEVAARNVLLRILRRKLAHQFSNKETVYLKIINIKQVKSMNLCFRMFWRGKENWYLFIPDLNSVIYWINVSIVIKLVLGCTCLLRIKPIVVKAWVKAFNNSLVIEISQMSVQNDVWQDSFKTWSKPCSSYAFWLILSSFVA